MLSSIHPLGERGKGNRFAVTAAAFVLGATAGGAVLGGVLAVVGLVPSLVLGEHAALAAVGIVALVAAGFEFTGRALPSIPRQVDENWLHEYRGWVYGFGFGFQLGAGVLTYITSAALYATIAAALLVGHPLAAVGIGVVFGVTRGLTLLPARSIQTPHALVTFHRRLDRSASSIRLASTSTLTVTALVAAAALAQELS